MRLAAVSVDLDELDLYEAIHGLPQQVEGPSGRRLVFEKALARLADWASAEGVPVTWFVVGRDAVRDAAKPVLRDLVRRGAELGNHSLDHLYDLTRCDRDEMLRQVLSAQSALEEASGVRPVGFRAPGYTMTDGLLRVLGDAGFCYDSSVFPCPPYFISKALVLGLQRLRGRQSRSILDSPLVLAAPTQPYRAGSPYWRRGSGLVEIPVQVTRGLRLPFIGTTLALAGPRVAKWLAKSLIGEPLVNLELHGIDALDTSDGIEALASYQPDLRRPVLRKLDAFSAALGELRRGGYSFVTMGEAASRVLGRPRRE